MRSNSTTTPRTRRLGHYVVGDASLNKWQTKEATHALFSCCTSYLNLFKSCLSYREYLMMLRIMTWCAFLPLSDQTLILIFPQKYSWYIKWRRSDKIWKCCRSIGHQFKRSVDMLIILLISFAYLFCVHLQGPHLSCLDTGDVDVDTCNTSSIQSINL